MQGRGKGGEYLICGRIGGLAGGNNVGKSELCPKRKGRERKKINQTPQTGLRRGKVTVTPEREKEIASLGL